MKEIEDVWLMNEGLGPFGINIINVKQLAYAFGKEFQFWLNNMFVCLWASNELICSLFVDAVWQQRKGSKQLHLLFHGLRPPFCIITIAFDDI